jgi:hypothetical protein
MKIYNSILFCFVPVLLSAQRQDYDIYSTVINNQLRNHNRINMLEEVVIVEKISSDELNWDMVSALAKDSVYDEEFVCLYYRNIADRFLTETDIRKVVAGIDNDITNQPVLDGSKIKLVFPHIGICIFNDTDDLRAYCRQRGSDFAPMSIFRFSKINYYGNFAAFYMGYSCGGLCGEGKIVVLEKLNEKWVIVWSLNVWMS